MTDLQQAGDSKPVVEGVTSKLHSDLDTAINLLNDGFICKDIGRYKAGTKLLSNVISAISHRLENKQ